MNSSSTSNPENPDKRPYSTPEIIHELELETRAGSPLTSIESDPLDLIGLDTNGMNGDG